MAQQPERTERIQKVIAECGLCSRRAAEVMIAAGRVKLNGRPVKLGDKMNPVKDIVSVDGENLMVPRRNEQLYLMLNKPRGYVTTAKDELGRKTVMQLLDGVERRVFPVGRLDRDSEGLLLLTSDGGFANLLTHPSHGVSKRYRVTVRPRASEDQVARLAAGVEIVDEDTGRREKTMPATVRVVAADGKEAPEEELPSVAREDTGRSVLEITIKEGKNRQIRRMCEAVGLKVARLKRAGVGPLKLGMLKVGEWRELTPVEVSSLKASATKAGRKR